MNNITFKIDEQYKNTISVLDGSKVITIKATENNDVLLNGKSIDNLGDLKVALSMVVKYLNGR